MAFVVDDDSNTARLVHDGANRLTKAVDPENNSLEWVDDGNGNAIETRTTDACQVSGVPSEVFLTTCFYDSLNRLQQRVDNIGESLDYRYDSRNNLVAASDANGPLSGTIARRAFGAGAQTQNTINGFGNVTLYSYDGLNVRTRHYLVPTASGLGEGTNNAAQIFRVKRSTPTPDQSQGGGYGLITALYQYDGNSLLTTVTDDNGNQTQRSYDNHNRVLSLTKGVCTMPSMTLCYPPNTVNYQDRRRRRLRHRTGSKRLHHGEPLRWPWPPDVASHLKSNQRPDRDRHHGSNVSV